MKDKIYIYPIWMRIWHWFNALIFIALIVTGLSLQYSNPSFNIVPFHIAVSLHNITGIALCIVYVIFLFGNHFTYTGQYYKIQEFWSEKYWKRLMRQIQYYSYGIFKGEECPFPVSEERKFNPLQKFTYVIIMYMIMPVIVLTGLALFFPEVLPEQMFGTTGIHFFDLIHIVTGFILSLFMIIHIYFCTIGKTPIANFKSMFTGWH